MQELEKILEEINEIEDEYTNEDHDIMFKLGAAGIAGDIKDIIRKHINDSWIPVEEGLPEEGREIWVSAKTECVRRGTYTKSFGDRKLEGFVCSDGFMWMNTANAWKPYVVPDPYIPKGEKHDC